MRKVLLPVDGSDSAERAAAYLADRAARGHAAEVHLLSVQMPIAYQDMLAASSQAARAHWSEEAARQVAQPVIERLGAASVACSLHVKAGDPAQEIAAAAQELGCDAIVMGTRGRSALASLVLGSVAFKVVELAQVPVTLVK